MSKKDRIKYERTGQDRTRQDGIGLNKTGLDRTGWVVKQTKIGRKNYPIWRKYNLL